jgi:hypothetical protein
MKYLSFTCGALQLFTFIDSALFMSWILVRQKQPSTFRTDLIVVTPEENLEKLNEINCTINARTDRQLYLSYVWGKL